MSRSGVHNLFHTGLLSKNAIKLKVVLQVQKIHCSVHSKGLRGQGYFFTQPLVIACS